VKDKLEDLGADGKTILKWVFKKWHEGMDCIDLAQEKERFRAPANAVTNLMLP
jgi:hypothetical protein